MAPALPTPSVERSLATLPGWVGLIAVLAAKAAEMWLVVLALTHTPLPSVAASGGLLTPASLVGWNVLRIHNFNSAQLKVNDTDGNPIAIAAVVVWRVGDIHVQHRLGQKVPVYPLGEGFQPSDRPLGYPVGQGLCRLRGTPNRPNCCSCPYKGNASRYFCVMILARRERGARLPGTAGFGIPLYERRAWHRPRLRRIGKDHGTGGA